MMCLFGHKWDKWRQYLYQSKDVEVPEGYCRCEVRQWRKCSSCGFMEDVRIRNGSMDGIPVHGYKGTAEKAPLGLDG